MSYRKTTFIQKAAWRFMDSKLIPQGTGERNGAFVLPAQSAVRSKLYLESFLERHTQPYSIAKPEKVCFGDNSSHYLESHFIFPLLLFSQTGFKLVIIVPGYCLHHKSDPFQLLVEQSETRRPLYHRQGRKEALTYL